METRSLELWSTDRIDLVEAKNGQAVTSSLVVADYFHKEHGKVLRAINQLECSMNFRQANFGLSDYTKKNGNVRSSDPSVAPSTQNASSKSKSRSSTGHYRKT